MVREKVEKGFNCYLLCATFHIIMRQTPVFGSNLNKAWDWTMDMEENRHGKWGQMALFVLGFWNSKVGDEHKGKRWVWIPLLILWTRVQRRYLKSKKRYCRNNDPNNTNTIRQYWLIGDREVKWETRRTCRGLSHEMIFNCADLNVNNDWANEIVCLQELHGKNNSDIKIPNNNQTNLKS